MSSVLNQLRAAAEPYKSFPKAVAAVIRAMFDRGAKKVEIAFGRDDGSFEPLLNIFADHAVFQYFENRDLIIEARERGGLNWALSFIHHSENSASGERLFQFLNLGQGEGVNAKQDRSARRLIRELPRLLSPREAYNTTVTDENGKTFKLVKDVQGTTVDGFRIDWPEKMIGFGREGLTLKFGAVRVPIGMLLGRLEIPGEVRQTLNILNHPWLQGVVEITVDINYDKTPIPTVAADQFSEDFYLQGHATTLARAMAWSFPVVVVRELSSVISRAMSDFVEEGRFTMAGITYQVSCATSTEVQLGNRRVLWIVEDTGGGHFQLHLDATHQVFRTVGPDREEIMQIIWWQLAMWIAQNRPEICSNDTDFASRATQIYQSLRSHNPERGDED